MKPMRSSLTAASLLLLAATSPKPPREESPPPRANLESFGAANSDEALASAIAAADAYPLGTLANPIRVAGPEGARIYLSRLRCDDGSIPHVGAETNGEIDTYGTVSEIYPVGCGKAAATPLVLDLYQEEHVETRAPSGFRIAP